MTSLRQQSRRGPGARRWGLTIVEILITLVLIATVFGGVFVLVMHASMRVYRGGDETLATIYASDIIEVVRGSPYEAFFWKEPELGMTLQDVFKKHPIPQRDDLDKYDKRFTILTDVMQAGDVPPAVLKKVRVTVVWKDRTKDTKHEVKLVTFYGPPR
ncbi:MAG: hypothetical protein HY816_04285 [Candidatus Wallbacteria bacterium]|nr:hypothetical protein [Candidatus Wallbacteria bacterium]